jgi:hypothetical protein
MARLEGLLRCSDASCEKLVSQSNVSPLFGRSGLRGRKARTTCSPWLFTPERLLFSLHPNRLCNCGQRLAIATTRTTGCSLRARSSWSNCPAGLQLPTQVNVLSGTMINLCLALRELRWSSRPAPRKQAASYQSAMKGDAWEGVK